MNKNLSKIFLASFLTANIFGTTTNALEANKADFKFIAGIKTFSSKFLQTQYTQDGAEKSEGALNIQKPSKFALDQKTSNMNIRIVSVNQNLKVFDNDTKQTTYIDNQYVDLLKFFDEDLKPESLHYIDISEGEIDYIFKRIETTFTKKENNQKQKDNKKKNKSIKQVCMDFKIGDSNLAGCLVVNSKENKLYGLNVYLMQNQKPVGRVMDMVFENQEVNNGVNQNVFVLRDANVFDENE